MESTQQALAPVRMAMGLMDDTPTARHSSIRDLRISTHPNIAGPLLGGAMLHNASENLTASGCHLTSRKRGGPHSRIDPERLLPSGGWGCRGEVEASEDTGISGCRDSGRQSTRLRYEKLKGGEGGLRAVLTPGVHERLIAGGPS